MDHNEIMVGGRDQIYISVLVHIALKFTVHLTLDLFKFILKGHQIMYLLVNWSNFYNNIASEILILALQ